MKLKTLFFLTSLILSSTSLFAKNKLIDSIGVENQDGKKVILHKLDPKDNYYSIGRRYNVKPGEIIKFNNNAPLKIGGVVKVPTDRPFIESSKPAVTQQPTKAVNIAPATKADTQPKPAPANAGLAAQQYKVSAGETLYSIAKRFNSTVEELTKLNNLTGTTLSPGQIIQVKPSSPDVAAPADALRTTQKRDSTNYVSSQDSADRRINPNKYGLFEKTEKGVATWIDDASLDPNKKLVLHRTAPIGTVIKITNPMTNRTTFVKVVGRFTETENTKDVIVVMTKNVAESLGALDKRFHVSISYGIPNE